MDICSLDWGAIGSFAGAGATIYATCKAVEISNGWRAQKRSEILSEIAKKLYKERKLYEDKLGSYILEIHKVLADYENGKNSKNFNSLFSSKKIYDDFHKDFICDFEIVYKHFSDTELKEIIDSIDNTKEELESLVTPLIFKQENESNFKQKAETALELNKRINSSLKSRILEEILISYILHKNS